MGFFSSLIGAFISSPAKVHKRPGKIGAINAWKAKKKGNGTWLPHDEYVRRKRGK